MPVTIEFGIYTHNISRPIQGEAREQSNNNKPIIYGFGSRFTYLINLPVGIVTRIIDTALAAIYMAASFASLCMEPKAYALADRYLNSLTWLVPFIFQHVLKIINPKSIIDEKGESISITAQKKIYEIADGYRDSKNVLLKYVVSRIMYLASIPILAICRVVDLAIGLIAAVFALVLLGTQKKLNIVGFYFLGITGVVQDIFKGVSCFINPWLPKEI